MPSPVVTRFAPSPTGFLHIGGARTALFNWLYARHTGGKMLLRIEDTDRERSTDAAIAAILDGLVLARARLGRRADLPVRARRRGTARSPRSWSKRGKAYRAYETPEELAAMREKAKAEGRFARYDGLWRDRDPSEAPAGAPSVIRIKAPLDGETVIQDHVQGRVAFPNKDLDDFILLRSDGTPTYMHAVVVDDHDMGVTHVIRGDDHLTNAGRQTIIYEAMDWPMPRMGAPAADPRAGRRQAFQAPRRARRRCLPRHGLSAGGAAELSRAARLVAWRRRDILHRAGGRMVRASTRSTRAPARFDFERLQNLNGHYMREADDAELLTRLEAILPEIEGGAAFAARLDAIRPAALSRCCRH